MKRLLLIGLATILGIGSLATEASADQDWSRNRESYHQAETSNLSPITEPLRYRVERHPETLEPEVHKDKKWQRVDRYNPNYEYTRKRHRHIKIRFHNRDTRYDPGRH